MFSSSQGLLARAASRALSGLVAPRLESPGVFTSEVSAPAAQERLTTSGAWPLALVAVLAVAILCALIGAESSTGHDTLFHWVAGLVVVAIWLGVAIMLPRQKRAREAEVAALSRRSLAAETANAAKSRYIANISHEIRSPLNAIYGYAQLVERSEATGAKEAVRVIRRSAEHLTSLVDGLLDIAQLENGVIRIKSDVVNVREFIRQIGCMLRPEAMAKGLEFRAEIPPNLPQFVRMDQSRLRQVLINLLSNAIKFTDCGSVMLRVRYTNQIAVFEIVDTGPGIAKADRERVFIPFERGSEGHRDRSGVGLGLPITKAIVEMLGGQIELESEPGRGSCFRVTLMLGEVLAPVGGKGQPGPPAHRVAGVDGEGCSVLLVDDDMQQLSFMRTLLDSLGFVVTAVPNGETAVALCRDVMFDLAILDITLPGMSGWDTAAQLRSMLGDELRVIMLSANVQEYHRPATDKPAHDLFLVKPVEFGTLIEAVGSLLNVTWKREDMASTQSSAPRSGLPADAEPYLVRIREFLSIGHYRGVEKAISDLSKNVPEAHELSAFLIDCLDRFDLSAMARKLEDC